MTNRCNCTQAETLAGAIALGEAGQSQLDLYRAHLATCDRCRRELGGEREIERVMATAPAARDAERWDPDLRGARERAGARSRTWQFAVALVAAVVVVFVVQTTGQRSETATPEPAVRASSGQAERAIAALNNQTAPQREHAAESLVVNSAAPATMTFKVSFNERGMPKQCTITKSSGRRALDDAVCRAAMRPVYSATPPERR